MHIFIYDQRIQRLQRLAAMTKTFLEVPPAVKKNPEDIALPKSSKFSNPGYFRICVTFPLSMPAINFQLALIELSNI